ncbi:hypothetical protein ABIE45_005593 [Methylobacterium sp. OAE515]|uniref:hypothetical protein n=1 Tax=Methylobacterium sp. OAE515 TaxID=2817895 RepID=UPI00178BAD71
MRDDFGSLFALNAALRSDPSASVLANGLPCGPFDQKLLNELFFTLSSTLSELNTVLDTANIVPDETAVNQLVSAIAKIAAANSPTIAQATVTLWVRTDGNDANDGSANTAGKAFQTIAAAIKYGLSRYVFAGFSLIIKLGLANTASNPYAPPGQINGAGNVTIMGGDATANNYVIGGAGPASGNSALVLAGPGSQITLSNVTVQNTGALNHSVGSVQGGSMTTQNVAVVMTVTSTYSPFFSFSGGNTSIQAGCSVSCVTVGSVLYADYGALILSGALSVLGSPNSTTAFAYCRQGAFRFGQGAAFSLTGSPTGQRYLVLANGVIDTGGLSTAFPGTTAGSVASGGQYI